MSLTDLPVYLPAPKDNGEADHSCGLSLPELSLPSTNDNHVTLGQLSGWAVINVYSMTGRPWKQGDSR